MRQTRTRILSLLLALVMCLSLLPVTALAAGGGSGEPALFLDPEQLQTGYYHYGETYSQYDPLFYRQAYAPDKPIPPTHTVQLFYVNRAEAFEVGNRYEGTDSIDLRDRYGRIGFEFVSITPETTEYSYDSNTKILTYQVDGDIDITIRSYYLDFDYTITYDLNGAGSAQIQKVKNGSPSIPKPADPSMPGYRFLGWYEGEPGADGYLYRFGSARFDHVVTEDKTFYAMWEKETPKETAVRVNFYPNGGRITEFKGKTVPAPNGGSPFTVDDVTGVDMNSGVGWTNTLDSGLLYDLPSVEREGYTFDGWYFTGTGPEANQAYDGKLTDFSKLTPFDPSKKISGSAELAAKWTAADVCTVTFQYVNAPNTATAPAPIKVPKGSGITLPKVELKGYTLLKWISGEVKGSTLYPTDVWTDGKAVTADVTLYAIWEEGELNETLKGLTYRFGNTNSDYGYDQDYNIPLERYQLIFGNNELAKTLYNDDTADDKKWGGSCYGMSTTSAMFFEHIVSTTSFKSGSAVPYDLAVSNRNSSWNLTLTQYIEAMQISQKAQRVAKQIVQNTNNLSALQTAVKSSPVIVTIYGPEGGHAVVGYDVKTVTNASGQSETGLMIYDPNCPNQEKHITLSGGSGWSYYMGKMYVNGELADVTWNSENGWISYVPYTVTAQVWSDRGSEKNYFNTMNLISISADNATISNSAGEVVAAIKDGKISSSHGDVTPIYETDIAVGNTSVPAMWLPTEQYTVTNTGSESQFTVSMVNVDQAATVSTSASSVTFAVKDDKALNYVQIDQAGAKYDITLSSTLNQGHSDVQLTGTTATGGISLAQISGVLYGEGVDSGAALKVDGKSAAISSLSNNMPNIENLGTAGTPQPTATTFPDVKPTAWYAPAVAYASSHGYMVGNADGTFNPDGQVRGTEFAQILYNKEGKPAAADGVSFKGVTDQWYAPAILWAAGKGIITDAGDTAIVPTASLTRQQIALMLYNYMGKPVGDADLNKFSDADKISDWAVDAVKWAVSEGIFKGNADGTFNPTGTAKRSETAQILMNFFG